MNSARDVFWDLRFFARTLVRRRRKILEMAPLRTWIPMLRRGFYPDRYSTYQLDRNDWRLYVTDLQVLKTSRLDWEYGFILHDKLLFESIVGEWTRVPKTLVLVRACRPLWFRNTSDKGCSLREIVRQHEMLFHKPKDRLCGQGAGLLEYKDGTYVHNGRPVDSSSVDWALFGPDDTMICEYVRQGSFTAKFHPRTVNTVRAMTMLDPIERRPFMAAAALRMGSSTSFPVDNIAADGVFCNIDLETGKLGQGVADFFQNRRTRRISHHPETDTAFDGETVPGWSGIREDIISIAARLDLLPYVAWDVALLDDGISIIEGNRWGDLAWFQVERPLLADERIRRFFEHHNVLRSHDAMGASGPFGTAR